MKPSVQGALAGLAAGVVAGGVTGGWVAGELGVGDLASWVEGVGTIGALIYAGRALRLDLGIRQEQTTLTAWEHAQDVELSSTVSFPEQAASALGQSHTKKLATGVLTATNGSLLPLTDVVVVQRWGDTELGATDPTTVVPKATVDLVIREEWVLGQQPQGASLAYVEWSDLGKRRWKRTLGGGVEHIS